MVDIRSVAASSRSSHCEQETEGEATSRSKAGRPGCACGVSATPSRHPRDDVALSQPEARGGCCSAAVSLSLCLLPEGSRISVSTRQGARRRRFLALIVVASRSPAPTPPRGPVVNVF
jgi:hypothetical protein